MVNIIWSTSAVIKPAIMNAEHQMEWMDMLLVNILNYVFFVSRKEWERERIDFMRLANGTVVSRQFVVILERRHWLSLTLLSIRIDSLLEISPDHSDPQNSYLEKYWNTPSALCRREEVNGEKELTEMR